MAFFKAKKVERKESTGFLPVPKGTYGCSIFEQKMFKSEGKTTLSLGFSITDFESKFANRKFWHNFNLEHPNEASVSISEMLLSQVCDAIGLSELEDPSELEYKLLRVFIVVNGTGNDAKAFYAPADVIVDNDGLDCFDTPSDQVNDKPEPPLTGKEIEDCLVGFDEPITIKDTKPIEVNTDIVDFDKDIPF
jgi:hypothetical protein